MGGAVADAVASVWTWAVCALVVAAIAWHVADGVAGLAAMTQEWMEKRFGFPRRVVTGREGLIGRPAVVEEPFERLADGSRLGWVRVQGERWRATLAADAGPAPALRTRVRVDDVRGLTLVVSAGAVGTAPPGSPAP
jgi:membrane protein implicated in regulation of membrane protease activity